MPIQDREPLKLTLTHDWPLKEDQEVEAFFSVTPSLQMAEVLLVWGPGPRQSRSIQFQEADLEELHEWLRGVLGLEE